MADDQPVEALPPEPPAASEAEADRIRHIGYGAEGLGAFLLLGLGLLILLTRSPSPGIFTQIVRFALGAVGLAFWIGGVGLRWGWRGAAPTIIAAAPALAVVSAGLLVRSISVLSAVVLGRADFPFVPYPVALILGIPGVPLWAVVSYGWSLRHELQRRCPEGARTDDAAAVPKPRISTLAVVSFVLSLPPLAASLYIYRPLPILAVAITTLALALVAQVKIRRSRGQLAGLGFVRSAAVIYVLTVMAYPIHLHETGGTYEGNCLGNAKKLAMAMQSYLGDHGDIYPPADSWSDALKPYVSADSTFRCPVQRTGDARCSFAFNAALGGRRAAEITADPARLVLFFESDAGWNAHGGPGLLPAEPRHTGGDNLSFADGHAKWVGRLRQGDASPPRWQRAYPPDTVAWDPNL